MGNRKGSCYLTEIGTLAIKPLTLHDSFIAIAYFPTPNLSEIFEHVQKVTTACDSLRFLES